MTRTNDAMRADILQYISTTSRERGYPPSIREIGAAVGLASPSSVLHHLRTLEQTGQLTRDPTRSRALSMPHQLKDQVPLLGVVGAGFDLPAVEETPEQVTLPNGLDAQFALRVRGDSMIERGIYQDDIVFVHAQPDAHDGEVVVATLDEEAGTVKTLRKRDGRVFLEAANSADPRYQTPREATDSLLIHGKVVGLLRSLA